MPRFKDTEWNLPADGQGRIAHWDAMKLGLLMDIRDELKKLNALFHCTNFVTLPGEVRGLRRDLKRKAKS